MPDPSLLAALKANPDDEARWLLLARSFQDQGRDDEAAVLRVFWPAIRETLAVGRTLESSLDVVRRNAKRLGRRAREVEERVVTDPESRA
jgi:hypothetical protein